VVGFAWKTVQVAAITSGGPTQDITISGIGTPIAVIIECSIVTTQGTGVPHWIFSAGAADGSNEFNLSGRSKDAGSSSSTGRIAGADGLVLIINNSANTIDGQAHWAAWITDGVRISWDNFPSSAYLLTVTLIYGTATQAKVMAGVTDGVQNQTDALSGAGFDPNVAMFWYNALDITASPSAAQASDMLSFGIACDNAGTVEQGSFTSANRDAKTIGRGVSQSIRNDCVAQVILQSSSGVPTYGTRLELVDFVTGSGGVNVKTVNGTTVFSMIVLLLDVGKARRCVKVVDLDTATTGSSGASKTITGSSGTETWKPRLIRAISGTPVV